jgi:peptidoglycan/LPS O-acetylase OafA/YrhL
MTGAAPRAERFPALDGMRALAAFAVVSTHVGFDTGRSLEPDLLGPLLSRGDFGVTVFFLLSGFLLYRPFASYSFGTSARPAVGVFLWRRALRILPAMWLLTAIVLAFITPYRVRASDWLHYLLLIQTYDHHDYDPNLSQLWSLTIEVSFYALLPLLAAAVGGPARGPARVLRRQLLMLAALVAAALTYNIIQSKTALTTTQALLWLPGYLDWFAAGMALAVLSTVPAGTVTLLRSRETLRIWAINPGTCWLVAAVLFALTTLPLGIPRTLAPATFWEWTVQHYLYGAAAFFLLLPLVLGAGGRAASALGSRFSHLMADLSYGIYLWHVPIMLLIQRELGFAEFKGHFVELWLLTIVCTVAVAAASWFLVERPLLRHGSRPWRGRVRDASAPSVNAPMHIS